MTIAEIFSQYFNEYKELSGKDYLSYFVTSTFREDKTMTNPHGVEGNAIDFILLSHKDYAPISEYNDLFAFMLSTWEYRAGIDNTWGNIHIHIDLGWVRPQGQDLPFFFKEDDGVYKYQITSKEQI